MKPLTEAQIDLGNAIINQYIANRAAVRWKFHDVADPHSHDHGEPSGITGSFLPPSMMR